jgi:DNA polymerase-3 subunit gamma/tau
METLANIYRPATFEDVIGQDNIKIILQRQLESGTVKNAYLFVGSQGTGKTTCARILANEINKGYGNPIEMDAASNSGVEDVRNIIQQAQTKSLDSEYKVFIIDECHSISNTGWQAFLKLLEEPPAKSIFIFCTTNPEKIPKTILSRVQRFDFQRINQKDIISRLTYICSEEMETERVEDAEIAALQYISKLANGGMRDAITMLDKCLSYSKYVSVENVIHALGTVNYEDMFNLYTCICENDASKILVSIDKLYNDGKDLKQFMRNFLEFVLDINKYAITHSYDFTDVPEGICDLDKLAKYNIHQSLLSVLMELNNAIKWDKFPKSIIEITLLGVVYDRSGRN